MKRLVLVLALLVSIGVPSSGCWGKATVTPVPTGTEVQQVRATSVRIMDEVRRGVAITRVLRTTAQSLTVPNGPITVESMNQIDTATIKYGGQLRSFLTILENITTIPNLRTTAREIINATAEYAKGFPAGTVQALVDVLLSTFDIATVTAGGVA